MDPETYIYIMRDHILAYSIYCVMNGILKGVESLLIGIAGENLTAKVRMELMKGILYKQLSWFDSEDKAPGVLTNIMAEDMGALNGMTTETIGVATSAFLCLFFSIAVYAVHVMVFFVFLTIP